MQHSVNPCLWSSVLSFWSFSVLKHFCAPSEVGIRYFWDAVIEWSNTLWAPGTPLAALQGDQEAKSFSDCWMQMYTGWQDMYQLNLKSSWIQVLNHSMAEVRSSLLTSPSPTPLPLCSSKVTWNQLPRTVSSWVSKVSINGVSSPLWAIFATVNHPHKKKKKKTKKFSCSVTEH